MGGHRNIEKGVKREEAKTEDMNNGNLLCLPQIGKMPKKKD